MNGLWIQIIPIAALAFFLFFFTISCSHQNTSSLAPIALKVINIADNSNLIFETKFWRVILHDDQAYLGRSIVRLKRSSGDLIFLTDEEWGELHEVIKIYELAVRKAFGATLFNWSCLMNHGYKFKPYTPLIHWHVRPRYKLPVSFAGLIFTDSKFGKHYARGSNRYVTKDIREKIIEAIRNATLEIQRKNDLPNCNFKEIDIL